LRRTASYDVLSVKICPTVGERKDQNKLNIRTFQGVNISCMWGEEPPERIDPKFFLAVGVRDVITWFKFGNDRLMGLGSAEGQILPFPVDFDGRPYNTLTLPCERVISPTFDDIDKTENGVIN